MTSKIKPFVSKKQFLLIMPLLLGSGQAFSSACSDSADPTRTQSVKANNFMVTAANPLAVEAGCEVLADGGSAIDAAVAVQAALSVVEPEASGLAGGSIITYWDSQSKRVRYFEGLSRAPKAVTDGLRTPTEDDVLNCGVSAFGSRVEVTGRAFGVPGTLKVLDQVHQIYGKKDWNRLFESSISLAEDGFPMPLYMNTVLAESTRGLSRCEYPDLGARYCDAAVPKAVDTPIFNNELAQVLREVRDGGAEAFYDPQGNIAPAIIERITEGQCKPIHDADGPAVIPSLMTVDDFAAYQSRERNPVCDTVFWTYDLWCGTAVIRNNGCNLYVKTDGTWWYRIPVSRFSGVCTSGDRSESINAMGSPRVYWRPRL